jgi:hypothetical protein
MVWIADAVFKLVGGHDAKRTPRMFVAPGGWNEELYFVSSGAIPRGVGVS